MRRVLAGPGLFLVALLTSSCLNNAAQEYIYDTAPVVDVEVLGAQRSDVRLLVSGRFSDTCWEYVGPRLAETGPHEYTIELEARKERGVGCLTVQTPFEEEVIIPVPEDGEYRFVFPRTSGIDPIVRVVTVVRPPN